MALQTPAIALLDDTLRRGTPRRNPLGLPVVISGGFALTFDITVDRERYAVRCFHKEGKHLQQRYAAVADFIDTTRLGFLVDVAYIHPGVRVGTETFPIVRMPWVDGVRLDDWIDDHLHEPAALDRVRRNISAAVSHLRELGAAHGDLQHGNILVRSDDSIRLVDYDGMYLPALCRYGAAERGHRNYQHPDRAAQYDTTLDLFAAHVIDLSLAAIAHEPQLWTDLKRSTGESLLFEAEDYTDPAGSAVFSRLGRIRQLTDQVDRLRRACGVGFETVPAALGGSVTTVATPLRSGLSQTPPAIVLRATDRAELLNHQGDDVTVVGWIVDTKTIERTGTITFLNFGNYRSGAFTVVAWERGHQGLVRSFGAPDRLIGCWVSVTGLLSVYKHPKTATITPQIELNNARSISILTPAQAATLLGTQQRPRPAPPPGRATGKTTSAVPTAPRSPSPQAPISVTPATGMVRNSDLQTRLGRLYSTPTFTSQLTNPASAGPAHSPTPTPRPASTPGTGSTAPAHPAATSAVGPPSTPAPGAPSNLKPPAHQQYHPPLPRYPGPPPTNPQSVNPANNATPAESWFGVIALILAFFTGPVGLVLGAVALTQQLCRTDTDRVCARISLVIGSVWMLCLCSIVLS